MRTIHERKQIVNGAIKTIVDFYKEPLSIAINRLVEKGDTLDDIAATVFKGEISRQAIHQNYVRKAEEKK